jgi:septum formation protein
MKPGRTIWLASRSPRRSRMMTEAGYDIRIAPADIDDSQLTPGDVPPEWWVMSLAYLKGRRVAESLRRAQPHAKGIVLAADTVCAVGRRILGQPRDAEDARRMLGLLHDREHRTLTGVCLLPLAEAARPRQILFDAARVCIGPLRDTQIGEYVASGEWQGKAGAYNLSERIAAGWPITCEGDPATVMGLPMQKLPRWLERATELLQP